MAYVVSAEVSGLAGREDVVRVVFDRYANIIWGLNGTGKSMLLKVLHSAMADDASTLADLPVRSAKIVIYSELLESEVTRTLHFPRGKRAQSWEYSQDELELDYYVDAPSQDVKGPTWATAYKQRPVRKVRRLTHSYLSINRLVEDAYAYRYRAPSSVREGIDDSFLDTLFARQVTERWQTYYSESLSRVRDIQQQGLGRVLSVLFGGTGSQTGAEPEIVDVDQAYGMARDFLRNQGIGVNFTRASFSSRYNAGPELREVVAHIQAVTERIDNALRPQREFQDVIRDLFSGNKVVSFDPRGIRVRVGDESIPLRALSSGERQLLHILLQALSGGSNSVIIDEPEISLHVDWQERLVESMRILNPDCQLILATHSPEVMANVDDEHIRQL